MLDELPTAVDVPISSITRTITQQPMSVTPPSSATPIAANTGIAYAALARYADIATPTTQGVSQQRASSGTKKLNSKRNSQKWVMHQPSFPYLSPEGREICVERPMRDQDMTEVYVTFLGSGDEKVMNSALSSARVWPRRKKSERGQALEATARVSYAIRHSFPS